MRNPSKVLLLVVGGLVFYFSVLRLPYSEVKILAPKYDMQFHHDSPQEQVMDILSAIENAKSSENNNPANTPVPRCSPEERIELLRHECKGVKTFKDLTSQEKSKVYNNIYVDEKHNVLTCIPPKAGCSTWKTILANNTFDDPLSKGIRTHSLHFGALQKYFKIYNLAHYNESMRDHMLTSDNHFRFVLVRHPLERLYSAYINKLVSGIDAYMLKQYGSMILNKYHPELSESARKSGKGVTFEEFVRFLKDPQSRNPHWEPVVNLCQPCLVDYHAIVKTQTMDDDNVPIITNHMLPYKRGLGTANNVVAGGPQLESLTQNGRKFEEYITLSNEEMSFLQERFAEDLRYFG